MRHKKIRISKVQEAFNKAIIRRDMRCMVANDLPCSGGLQCSHYYPVGGNSCLRFYPFNAYAQCAGHHLAHHNRDPLFYTQWMQLNHAKELYWMESVRGKSVRYTQVVLNEIYTLCQADNLDGVAEVVRGLF